MAEIRSAGKLVSKPELDRKSIVHFSLKDVIIRRNYCNSSERPTRTGVVSCLSDWRHVNASLLMCFEYAIDRWDLRRRGGRCEMEC
jgi:hypothetical protein